MFGDNNGSGGRRKKRCAIVGQDGAHVMGMQIVFKSHPDEKEIKSLEQRLFNFNREKVDGYSYENFIIKALGDADSMIAGIHARIGGGWLYIVSLWVDENHRGKGLGSNLLRLAEENASANNCHGAYLYTYSFQSPGFYKKLGYVIMGTLEGFCDKHTKYFMKKKIA